MRAASCGVRSANGFSASGRKAASSAVMLSFSSRTTSMPARASAPSSCSHSSRVGGGEAPEAARRSRSSGLPACSARRRWPTTVLDWMALPLSWVMAMASTGSPLLKRSHDLTHAASFFLGGGARAHGAAGLHTPRGSKSTSAASAAAPPPASGCCEAAPAAPWLEAEEECACCHSERRASSAAAPSAESRAPAILSASGEEGLTRTSFMPTWSAKTAPGAMPTRCASAVRHATTRACSSSCAAAFSGLPPSRHCLSWRW
mmetsp:Transcript_21071/g.53600  ORF Transcript_21071/g.53600 Transcript_21071/m.53600 type:complete len:260 (+) Transcript_21071:402-1181(+)